MRRKIIECKSGVKLNSLFLSISVVCFFCLTLTLSSCREDDPPIPVEIRLDSFSRSILLFNEGSWWVYQSDDGLYDTVTVLQKSVTIMNYVDKEKRPLGSQEFFSVKHYSTRSKQEFRIYRADAAPTVPLFFVELASELGQGNFYYVSPFTENETYGSPQTGDNIILRWLADTIISGESRNRVEVNYAGWNMENNEPATFVFVEKAGIVSKKIGSRNWRLIDSRTY